MKFRPDIEGLRALAVLIVVLFHARPHWLPGGFVGVDVFFTLSGYLITGILLAQYEKFGTIDLPRFYARRARRLLPASALMVVFVTSTGLLILPPNEQRALAQTALAVTLYSSNLHFAWSAGDYFGRGLENDPLLHTWSLGVEEQFYFAWPLALLIALRTHRPRLLIALGLLTFPMSAWSTSFYPHLAFFLSPLRAWEFALGGAGVVFATRLSVVRGGLWAGLGLAMITGSAVLMSKATAFPGFAALVPTIGTLLVVLACSEGGGGVAQRVLATRPAQELGRLSYSWYLWHWPFLVFGPILTNRPLTTVDAGVAVALSLVAAALSHRFVEQPLRYLKVLAPNGRSLAFGATLMVLGMAGVAALHARSAALMADPEMSVLMAAVERHPEVRDGLKCQLNHGEVEHDVDGCTVGAVEAPHILLIGDSHSRHWFPSLKPAIDRGELRVTLLAKSGCPAVTVPRPGASVAQVEECMDVNREILRRIPSLDVDVVVAGALSYSMSEAQWREGFRELLQVGRDNDVRIVLLQDVRRGRHSPTECLARNAMMGRDDACRFHPIRPRVYDQVVQDLAAENEGVDVLLTHDLICQPDDAGTCPAMRDGLPIWRDTSHLSVDFARAISPEFLERLEPSLP